MSASSEKSVLVPCPAHKDENCGLCNGTKFMRNETLSDDGVEFQILVPSNLTKEEAQKEYTRSINLLLKNFKEKE